MRAEGESLQVVKHKEGNITMRINGNYENITANALYGKKLAFTNKAAQENKKNEAESTTQDKTVYDDTNISKEGKSLLVTGKEKAEQFRQQMHFCTFGDIREIPANYKIENLFKMDLKADSIFGGENLFQSNSTSQYKVFDKWLDNNATGMSEEQMQMIKAEIKNATGVIDVLNNQEGYRGTSFESVALLEASKSYLENLKSTMIPEELREVFQSMIDEYAYFNETSRDSLMQRMTPDYMVVGIGNNTVSYKYKNEIIQSEQSFYSRESKDISAKFADYYSGGMSKETLMKDVRNYITDYFTNKKGSSDRNKAEISTDIEDLLGKLAGLMR